MKSKYMYMLVSFLVPVALYFQTVTFGYTDFDDNRLIKDNAAFLSDNGNIPEAFKTDAFISGTSHFYRPLQVVSYMADIWISGGIRPWMFHLTNVLLFGFISCALFLFLVQFGISRGYALPAALIFVVNPLFVPAIAWIPARGELLLTLFALITFLALENYCRSGKARYLIVHTIAFISALFSKETAVLLPVLFIIYFLIKSKSGISSKKSPILIAIYIVSGFAWFRIRLGVIADLNAGKEFVTNFGDEIIGAIPFIQNIRTIPAAFSRFLLPVELDLIPSFTLFRDITGTALLILMGLLLLRNQRMSKSEKMLCVFWFLCMMLPPMFFKHKLIDYLDHRFLLPLIGVIPGVLMLRPRIHVFNKPGNYRPWITIICIIVLSVLTLFRSRAYSDPMKFYTSAIAQNPASSLAHNNLGAIFHNKGNYVNAIKEYSAAINLKEDYLNAYNNRANAYLLAKSFRNAIQDYSTVINMDPDDANAYNSRGVAFLRNSERDKACRDFQKASAMGSSSAAKNYTRFCKKREE